MQGSAALQLAAGCTLERGLCSMLCGKSSQERPCSVQTPVLAGAGDGEGR